MNVNDNNKKKNDTGEKLVRTISDITHDDEYIASQKVLTVIECGGRNRNSIS